MKMGKTIRGLLAVLGLFLSSGVLNAQTDITVRGGPNWPDSKSGNGPDFAKHSVNLTVLDVIMTHK